MGHCEAQEHSWARCPQWALNLQVGLKATGSMGCPQGSGPAMRKGSMTGPEEPPPVKTRRQRMWERSDGGGKRARRGELSTS